MEMVNIKKQLQDCLSEDLDKAYDVDFRSENVELGLSSIDILDLLVSLEDKFRITIPEDDFTTEKFLTSESVAAFVSTYINAVEADSSDENNKSVKM